MKINLFEKKDSIALDNFRDFARVMGSRIGNFLHDGRVHPYSAGPRRCSFLDSDAFRPKNSFLIGEAHG